MKHFLKVLFAALLCLAPTLGSDATQRVAALVSPQAINVDLGFVHVGNVGNLSVMGAPGGATFSLLNNPGGHFSISGTEIVADPATPAGQYSIQVQASGTGYSVHKTFVLNFAGTTPGVFAVRVNMSGMEDNGGVPSTAELSYFKTRGANGIRLPLSWAQMQTTASGALAWGTIFDSQTNANISYNTAISLVLSRAASLGMDVLLDLHNFGQDPNGNKIGQPGAFTPTDFANFWSRFVTFIRADPNYAAVRGWDTMNEWNGMGDCDGNSSCSDASSQALILNADTLAMNAIRATGDTKLIVQEWDHFTGSWDAVTNNISMLMDMVKTDPAANSMVHVHGYPDHDCSGTGEVWATEAGQPGLCPTGINTNVNVIAQRGGSVVSLAAVKGVRIGFGETGISNDYIGNPVQPGNDDYQDWNATLTNFLTYAQGSNVEVYLWGNGPGFPNPPGYGYNFEPTQVATPGSSPPTLGNPGIKDYTSAGLQATQMVVVEQFTGYTGAQPPAYRVDLPLNVTPYAPSGTPLPNFKIRYNGIIPNPITFAGHATLADGSNAGGTFSSTVMPAGNNGIVTFSYTPSGSHTAIQISFTNNAGLTDPPPVGITSFQDLYLANNITPANVFALRLRYSSSVKPALNLQRADSTNKDFYYNLRGDLPRQAIQDWALSRSICVNTIYNQFNSNDLGHVGGPCATLNLVNAAGYPEIIFPANAQYGFNTTMAIQPSAGNTQQTIISRISDGGGSTFLDMSNANVGSFFPFRFSPSAYTVTQDPANTTATVSFGATAGVYHEYTGTFTGGQASGLVAYRDGTQVATASTATVFNLNTAGSFVTNGYFFFFPGTQWTGSYTNFDVWPVAGSGAVVSAFATDDATYYSTPLPDPLSPLGPSVSGMVAPQVSMDQGAPPLWQVAVNSSTNLTASIAVTGAAGTMSHLGPYAPSGSGPYTISALSPTEMTRALRNLLWEPGSSTAGTTTTFTVTVADTFSQIASASNTITNVAPQALPTPLTPVATPASLPSNFYGLNMSGGQNEPNPDWRIFLSQYGWANSHGFNTIRVPFSFQTMTNVTAGVMTSTKYYQNFNSSYVSSYQASIENTRTKGQYALLDDHSFGYGQNPFYTGTSDDTSQGIQWGSDIRVPVSAFVDAWTRQAQYYKNYPNVFIDMENEPPWSGTFSRSVMTAVSASIRTNVSTTVPIIAPTPANASSFDTSGTWNGYTDPAGGPFYMGVHNYFDGAGGTLSTCQATPVANYFSGFVTYIRAQGFKGFVSEFGWGTDSTCNSGFGATVPAYFQTNNDVIKGWQWFSYGDFPPSYVTYMGPTNGPPGENDPPGSSTDPIQYAALRPYLLPGSTVNLSNSTVASTASAGTTVGTLSVTGGSGSYTYALTSNPGGLFSITGSALKVAATLTAGSDPITVQANNGAGDTPSQPFSITVTPSSSPWTPLQLNVTNPGTLVAWWDAQDSAHITQSGGSVSSWADEIGGIAATQATFGAQPTYSATARNGKPGITSNGSQVLSFSPSALPGGTSSSTIALAGYFNSSGSTGAMFTYGALGSGQLRAIYKNSSGQCNVTNNGSFNLGVATCSNNDLFTIWQDISGTASQVASGDGNAPNLASVTPTSTVLTNGWMFAWIDGSTFPVSGTVQQVLVLNRSLTLDESTKLAGWESWYDGKAGLNLPNYSPYKARAPLISDTSGSGPLHQAVTTTNFPIGTSIGAQAGSVQPLVATVNMLDVQIVIPHVYSSGEATIPGTLTAHASLEYPPGNCQTITFGGSATGTTTGPTLTSDDVTLSPPVPLGAAINLHLWGADTSSTFPIMSTYQFLGGGSVVGTTATDTTTSCGGMGSFSPSATAWSALIVAAKHNQPSEVTMGDSIAYGIGEGGSATFPGGGIVNLGLTSFMANASFGIPGDTLGNFVSGSGSGETTKITLANTYFSTVVNEYGVNDLGSSSAATLETQSGTFNSFFPSLKSIRTTITPRASSSDNFATTTNQTPAGYTPQLSIFNTWARGLGACNYYDMGNPLSFGVDTNIWNPGDTATNAPWSGVHPTAQGYIAVGSSGVVIPSCVN